MNSGDCRPIGVFDSGIGGVSVLAEAIRALPHENFIYYGDSGNAPYGTRDEETIRRLTREAVGFLENKGIKALVVACNTATSAAIETLRKELDIPVIGMEPAVKPAITKYGAEKVYVMATPATLRLRKFNDLMSFFSESAQILPIPCPGLMEIIERAVVSGPEIDAYVEQAFAGRKPGKGDVVVLGCTHYVFLKKHLEAYFGEGVEVIDGNLGTVNQLIARLKENDSLCGSLEKGEVCTFTSGDESVFMPVFQRLLTL